MVKADQAGNIKSLDELLLDFMRVIRAQHQLQASDELQFSSTKIWLHLDQTAPLFVGLGLEPQSKQLQWMLILKLYREFCLDGVESMYQGMLLKESKLFMGYHINYNELDDEVMLDILPGTFKSLYERLERTKLNKPINYLCRLWQNDNQLLLTINDQNFRVARLNDGSRMAKLIHELQHRPANVPLTAVEFQPLDTGFSFKQELTKNNYGWLEPMLSIFTPKSIALQNPADLTQYQLRLLVSRLNEKYREPILQHLAIT
jgi:hypothetical protein